MPDRQPWAMYTEGHAPRSQDVLVASGLFDGEQLTRQNLGSPFKTKPGSEVHKVLLADGTWAYLKRYDEPRQTRGIRQLLHACLRPSIAKCEYMIAKLLRDHNFCVMTPLAWGEERLFGVAISRSAVLVQEVLGVELDSMFRNAASTSDRHELLVRMGELIGELHAIGFYHALRIHDIIAMRQCGNTHTH